MSRMRVMRSSFYSSMYAEPVATVLREDDLVDTIDSARHKLMNPEHGFVVFDIFDMTRADIAQATMTATRRMAERQRRERDMATLFFYGVQVLRMLRRGGLWQTPDPAPLSVDEIRAAFEQLAMHPSYEDQVLATTSEDGTPVRVVRGRVEVGS